MFTVVQAHQSTITMSHDDFSDGTPQKDSDCKEGSVSTTWYKLGTQLLAKRQLKLAAGCFRKAIQCGGKDVPWEAHYNLAACLSSLTDKSEGTAEAEFHFREVLRLNPLQGDARVNLSGLLLKAGKLEEACKVCEDGLAAAIPLTDARLYIQLNTILRQMGRQPEAIQRTWRCVRESAGELISGLPKCERVQGRVSEIAEMVVFCCVKWGTKYGAEYVNRLAGGIRQGLAAASQTWKIVCLTDDSTGIRSDMVTCISIPEDLPLTGWWVKAYLFSPEFPLQPGCRVVYVDLDTVITGSLESLVSYRGHFATLTTDGLVNERRSGGYNSSIMMWGAGEATEVYTHLIHLLPHVTKFIQKFDHWIEMVMAKENVDVVQQLYPGAVVEYKSYVMDGGSELVAPKASLVCFPLRPKPHECTEKWIMDLWLSKAGR